MNERPHITLAQFLKIQDLAGSGGQAKHRVRAGGILVDGAEEVRPGRKLFGGEKVEVDGETYTIGVQS
jgi:ribosome-associated protein